MSEGQAALTSYRLAPNAYVLGRLFITFLEAIIIGSLHERKSDVKRQASLLLSKIDFADVEFYI